MIGRGAFVALLLMILFAPRQPAWAASLRCPAAVVGEDSSHALFPESPEMVALWTAVAEPHPDGSDGPLGCPIAPAVMLTAEPQSQFSGLSQKFQRGTLLVGNGGSAGFEVAAIRGLGGWFVWWKVPASVNFGNTYIAAESKPGDAGTTGATAAIWARGGFLRTGGQTATVALWRCEGSPCSWKQATSTLAGSSRVFEAAALLDLDSLARPDPVAFGERANATIPDWLPCYTVHPSLGGTLGEDSIARALVMARGTSLCPLTRVAPINVVDQWLATLSLPADQLPGTSSDSWPCKRSGELDITIIGLLHLWNEHKGSFTATTAGYLGNLLQAYGGSPRNSAYVQPAGDCLGFGVIETENHILLQESGRYLINALRGVDTSANRDWLIRFLQMIVRRDFYEYNAIPYTRYQMKALYALHDYAPDAVVKTAARGVLDWVFTKTALSANFDRDHRPFRRRPEKERYAALEWWGSATTASLSQTALFAGPLQHVHEDIDLELDHGRDESGVMALTAPSIYPEIGAAGENFAAEFTDAVDTTYRLPEVLAGWLGRRFTDDNSNRVTYIQAIHHSSAVKDDPALFSQPNAGVEMVSGNRNWTIVAGGNAVGPGYPPNPPGGGTWTAAAALAGVALGAAIGAVVGGPVGAVVGAAVGGLLGLNAGLTVAEQANKKQFETLWSDQPGIMRETTLIPSPVGLNRSQTIRFGQPVVVQATATPRARLCVAEGFMCGFDLVMPNRPFPSADTAPCPLSVSLPSAISGVASQVGGSGRTILTELGCLLSPGGDVRDWTVWNFEHGSLLLGVGDPLGKERKAALWIENVGQTRTLRLQWTLPGQFHDWYNAHIYNTDVGTSSGGAPGGDIGVTTSGDANNTNTWDKGEAKFDLAGVTDSTWSVIAEACDPTYGLFGIRTGHECHANILPKLMVNVALPPKQSFSCAAHDFRGQGLVLEVGDCLHGPYGLFVYVSVMPCGRCPDDASNYGFVVVAPSRGWTWIDFGSIVETSMAAYLVSSGHDYLPLDMPATVNVPMSPPVSSTPQSDGTLKWTATGPPTMHTVTFRFRGSGPGDANILSDTGAPTLYGTLSGDPETWPTAVGQVTSPDLPVSTQPLLHSSGQGCFTVAGVRRAGDSDPRGLVVDLRDSSALVIDEPPSSTLAGRCP